MSLNSGPGAMDAPSPLQLWYARMPHPSSQTRRARTRRHKVRRRISGHQRDTLMRSPPQLHPVTAGRVAIAAVVLTQCGPSGALPALRAYGALWWRRQRRRCALNVQTNYQAIARITSISTYATTMRDPDRLNIARMPPQVGLTAPAGTGEHSGRPQCLLSLPPPRIRASHFQS